MIKYLVNLLRKEKRFLDLWAEKNFLNLFIFNLTVSLLVLLSSADYFKPFFPLSINRIVFISLLLAIILFKANERTMFVVAIVFLFLAGFFKMVNVGVWAERSSVYVYQSFLLGFILFSVKILLDNKKIKK